MRRHAKRSTARTSETKIGRFTLALFAAMALALMVSPSALAAPSFGGSFNGSETPAKSMSPSRLAVDEETGNVYVLASTNDAINVFDADGKYLSQIKGETTKAKAFGLNGQYEDIAIDNSGTSTQGNIYVVAGTTTFFAFDKAGTFLWETGNLLGGIPCGIAVDEDGEVFGAEYGAGVQRRSTADGSLVDSPIVTSAKAPETCNIAFDSKDNLYVLSGAGAGPVQKLEAPGYAVPGTTLMSETGAVSVTDVEVNRSTDGAYTGAQGSLFFYNEKAELDPDAPANSPFGGSTYLGVAVNSATDMVYFANMPLVGGLVEIWGPFVPLKVINVGTGKDKGKVECDTGTGPEACAATYVEGTKLTLTATAEAGSTFSSFAGSTGSATSCTSSPCTFTIEKTTEVVAKFTLEQHQLTVSREGTAKEEGTVTSLPTGINCGATCSKKYDHGTKVKLSATPKTGVTFSGWTGACEGTGACEVTMDEARAVSATFAPTDTDGDGVPDKTDACPSQAGSEANGCPPAPPEPKTCATDPSLCPLPPVVEKEDLLTPCIAKANKAHKTAKKAAAKKKGKAKANALKAAGKRKTKAIKACKAQYAY